MRTTDRLVVHPWRPHWLCTLGRHKWRTLAAHSRGVAVKQCRRCYVNKWEDP